MRFGLIHVYIMSAIEYTVFINIGLGVFNLLPLPPLDGSKILDAFLPEKAHKWYVSHENLLQIAFKLFFALVLVM